VEDVCDDAAPDEMKRRLETPAYVSDAYFV
jgi:hypothetical protein